MKDLLNTCALIALASAVAVPAAAQDGAASSNDGTIVVTAERRATDVQDIPIAVTVLDAESLQETGTATLEGLQQVAPSLSINNNLRSTFVNIRGVGTSNSNPTGSSGVAIYLDGVLLKQDFFITQSFFDIGSVEVLRGPQGTLTGQNSTGGAIYLRSPAPEFGEFSGSLELTAGNYDAYRAVAALNLGLSDNVAIRIAGMHDERDSFTTNLGPSPSTPGNVNMDSARINIALRSNDDELNVNLRGEYFDSYNDNIAVKNRFDPVSSDPYEISEDAISFQDQHGYRLSLEANYNFSNDMTLRVIGSLQDGSTRETGDGDRSDTASPIPAGLPPTGANRALYPGRSGINFNENRTYLGEVNLISPSDSDLTWVIGAFYMHDTLDTILNTDFYNTSYISGQSLFDLSTVSESKSVFGQFGWFVTDNVELIGGLRHSWNDQELTTAAIAGFTTPPFTGVNNTSSTAWTGKVGINYFASDDVMLYITGSKGFAAGGNNPVAGQPGFAPEVNYVVELGAKTTLWDRRLRLNSAVFYSDHQNLQAQATTGFPPLPKVENTGAARTYGVEVEAMLNVGGFSGNVGVTWLDSQYSESSCIDNSIPVDFSDPSCAGRTQLVQVGFPRPYAPDWTVNAGLQYEFLLSDEMSLTPRVQLSHKSSQTTQPFPTLIYSTLPARTVIDARLTWAINDAISIDAFVNNLTDETYIAAQLQTTTSADGGYVYGAPRTYGVRFIGEF